jgi:sugar lactone lactonase YvrE
MRTQPRQGLLGKLWHTLRWVLLPVAILAGYLLFWPTPLNPYAWTPTPTPGTTKAPFVPAQDIAQAVALGEGLITNRFMTNGSPDNFGPEDVAIGPQDCLIYTGLADGSILRIDPRTGAAGEYTNTGGRPLGVTFTPSGDRLYVADGHLGLVAVDPLGDVTVLVNELDGEPFGFADNLDVAPDGTVWFSAPTRDHTVEQVALDIWDSRPTGRLLHYDPATGLTRTVLDNLYYANGVAVAEDGSFVLVAEFLAFRIQRYWITGELAGSHEIFIDNLPGYPDNITRTPDGTFLVGLSLARIPGLDKARPKPWLVELIYRLPPSVAPKPQFPGYLLELTPGGEVRRFMADETPGKVAQVTAGTVVPAHCGAGNEVVVGSLQVKSVRRMPPGPVRE